MTLNDLASEISQAHEEALDAARVAANAALRVGELLTQARSQVPPDQWQSWLLASTSCTICCSLLYQRVSAHRGVLLSKLAQAHQGR